LKRVGLTDGFTCPAVFPKGIAVVISAVLYVPVAMVVS
jgi:hypothetical protein